MIGHGHDGAGGSLNRACHGTGKLAELDTARTASGGDVGVVACEKSAWFDRGLISHQKESRPNVNFELDKTRRVLSYRKVKIQDKIEFVGAAGGPRPPRFSIRRR